MRIRQQVGKILIATTVCTGVAASLAGPASAAVDPTGVQTVWGRVDGSVGDDVASGAVATCPAGTGLLSAGVGNGRLQTMVPRQASSGPDFVSVQGVIDNAGAPFMPVQLNCVPKAQLAGTRTVLDVVRDRRDPGPYGKVLGATVACPAGYVAYAGSAFYRDPAHIDEATSDPSRTLWTDEPTADGTGWTFASHLERQGDEMLISTYCLPRPRRLLSVEVTLAPTADPGGLTATARGYANCPIGYGVLSAGVDLTPGRFLNVPWSTGDYVRYSQLVRSPSVNPNGWSWYAQARSNWPVDDPRTFRELHIRAWCAAA
jgi:hypothetical protein